MEVRAHVHGLLLAPQRLSVGVAVQLTAHQVEGEGRQLLQAHNGQFRLLGLALTLRMKLKEDLRGVTTIVIRLPQP